YVLSELALNTEINNNQNIRNQNKSTAPASASYSIVNGLVIAKKRGRKPLPRDENGKIIRKIN
ncbi:hypothetical protein BpHYR1_003570, partial [Brachionus plicatilis]